MHTNWRARVFGAHSTDNGNQRSKWKRRKHWFSPINNKGHSLLFFFFFFRCWFLRTLYRWFQTEVSISPKIPFFIILYFLFQHCIHQCVPALLWKRHEISDGGWLTPSLPQPVKISGWKMHGRACKQYISRFYNPSTFSAIRYDESPFTCHCEKENQKAYGFQISDFYWSFWSDTMAVKGLIYLIYIH